MPKNTTQPQSLPKQRSKSYYNDIGNEIKIAQIFKLSRKSGIKEHEKRLVELLRYEILPMKMEQLIETSILLADYKQKKVICVSDLIKACELRWGWKCH